jgi:hypothetical protein
MYKNEGQIHKNKRFNYFKDSLKDKPIQYKQGHIYTLSSNSKMWGSVIIGILALEHHLLQDADCLMLQFLKEMDADKAHTIEQFSLVEILRNKLKIIEGKKYISIYSTSSRKSHAQKVINNFLLENKQLCIKSLSEKSLTINLKRPILQIIKDKLLS